MTYTRYEHEHGEALIALTHLLNGKFPENRRTPFMYIEQCAPYGDRTTVGIDINWQALDNWSRSNVCNSRDVVVVQAMRALADDALWPSLDTLRHHGVAHDVWFAMTRWHGCPNYWRDWTNNSSRDVVLGELEEVRS